MDKTLKQHLTKARTLRWKKATLEYKKAHIKKMVDASKGAWSKLSDEQKKARMEKARAGWLKWKAGLKK